MNNAKIWLVVKPTVGIPLFLSAVAIGSFLVHFMVVTNSPWFFGFASGKPLKAEVGATSKVAAGETVVLPDGRVARVVIEDAKTASLLPAK
jgi:light-harvesting protein B-800-850 alpha chain